MREIQQQIDEIQMDLQSFERWGIRYLTEMLGEEYIHELINSIDDDTKKTIDISNFKFFK